MTELTTGSPAPTFEAKTDSGDTVNLADYRGRKVVLYFYPKDDTPGCTTQSCGFRDMHAEFEEKNAVVFGISPDGQESHAKFRTKFDLPFTLLVDEDHVNSRSLRRLGRAKDVRTHLHGNQSESLCHRRAR